MITHTGRPQVQLSTNADRAQLSPCNLSQKEKDRTLSNNIIFYLKKSIKLTNLNVCIFTNAMQRYGVFLIPQHSAIGIFVFYPNN